jgi:hypothetical protein
LAVTPLLDEVRRVEDLHRRRGQVGPGSVTGSATGTVTLPVTTAQLVWSRALTAIGQGCMDVQEER